MATGSRKIYSTIIIGVVYLFAFATVYFGFSMLTFPQTIINVLIADIAATVVLFIFSMILNNSSVYDPYWSVVPPLIVVYLIRVFPEGNQARQLIILCLVLFWSLRLTINWFRGWKGINHQDWRYTSIADQTGRWYWPVSFIGIHLAPTIFVFLGCLPLWYSIPGTSPINLYDIIASLFTLSAILLEWLADEQLIRFRKISDGKTIMRSGIWKHSRHPNYLGEISFWGGMFLFAVSSNGLSSFAGYWTVIGLASMIILFKFISIPLMEKRNRIRKPGYDEYINQVPALLPRFYQGKN
jgi:steroid 5-alpha reductase family enzyme